ncbi:MAG: class F sortase [Acidimicrobiia bacterium]|nr:MAG: class F sortase [Acidimicrobiia bacterium]
MRGSRTGVIGAAASLGIAGVIMLGIGLATLSGSRAAAIGPVATVVTSAELPPNPAVLSEVDNPIAAPAAEPASGRGFTATPPASPDLVPTRVRIPIIGVDTGVIDLGVNPDRTLEVPKDVGVTGWYTGRSVPGEVGPGVVVGHVDSAVSGPGIFFNLRKLGVGDLIEVERSDGSVAEFRVTSRVLVEKDEFPTEEVYGSTEEPTLRLITCGGSFDRGAGSYLSNVIVYAEHIRNREPVFSRS